jgi:hypothetical protein
MSTWSWPLANVPESITKPRALRLPANQRVKTIETNQDHQGLASPLSLARDCRRLECLEVRRDRGESSDFARSGLSRPLRRQSGVHSGVRPSDTPPSAHPPSSAPARERCTLARWRPNDSPRGTATVFAIAPAIPPTGADALDQSSPKISAREKTKSFAEAARARLSSSAESDNQRGQANGGQPPHADTPVQSPEAQTAKQWLKSFGPQDVSRAKRTPER